MHKPLTNFETVCAFVLMILCWVEIFTFDMVLLSIATLVYIASIVQMEKEYLLFIAAKERARKELLRREEARKIWRNTRD